MSEPAPQEPADCEAVLSNVQDAAKSADESASPRKLWHVGTLTYTAGGLVILFCWLLWGDFAWQMRDRALSPVVQLLLTKFKASNELMAWLQNSLPAALSCIVGPIISYNSDRHRGAWGRRIPYLLVSTPFAAVFMVGLAFSQPIGGMVDHLMGAHSPGAEKLTLIVFGVFWTFFEFTAIITGIVFAALVNDVVPRRLLGRFWGVFRIVSLLAGVIFGHWLMEPAEKHYQWVFGAIATLYGVGVLMMCFVVKEGKYPPPPDVTPGERKKFFTATLVYFEECFSKPYYIWVFVAMTLTTVCFLPIGPYVVPFLVSQGISMKRWGDYMALQFIISGILAYPLGILADRFHPLRLGILALTLYAGATLWGGLYATTPNLVLIALTVTGCSAGAFGTATMSLQQRLFPHSTFAQFTSAAGIMCTAAIFALSPVFGKLLDLSGNQYRYTFLMSTVLATVGVMVMLIVHAKFMRLGGPKGYVAPE